MSVSKSHSVKSPRLRIGLDGTPLFRPIDGIGRYTQCLISAYAEKYSSDEVYVVRFLGDPPANSEITSHPNIRFVNIPLPRRIYQALYSRVLRLPLQWLIPPLDAYVGTNFTVFPRIHRHNTLSVAAIHDIVYRRFPETVEKRNLRYLKKNIPLSIKEPVIIATSDFTRSEIINTFNPTSPVQVVSNGVDGRLAHQPLIKKRKIVLTVGTLEPRKNLDNVIRGFLLFQAKHPDYRLVVVGSAGWGEVLPPTHDSIEYKGYVDDMTLDTLYREASAFVFGPLYEGFGLPVLEALIRGTNVASSDIPPLRDIARSNAQYFDPLDMTSISVAISESVKKKPLPSSVRIALAKRYDWEISATKLRAIIENYLKRSE